jgi:dihydroflavonol-4-reductase
MKVLVTGATGFLGSHLVASLLAAGDLVVALCREDEPELADQGVTVVRGDVLDRARVALAARGCEGVYHAAGKVSRKESDAEELYRVHVEGTRSVLAASREAGVRRVVVASTSGTVAVSADPDHIGTENDETPEALIARWPYYRSKLYAERLALAANDAGFEVVCVNPTLLLGPGDVRGSSTDDVRRFLERRIPAVPPGGLSFVDARDAAQGMLLAMEKGRPGARYLLGACNLTLRELFARLARLSGVRAPWLPMPRSPELARMSAKLFDGSIMPFLDIGVDPISMEMAHYFWYLDASLAEKELGWSPRDPSLTLGDTVEDLRERHVVWWSQASVNAGRGFKLAAKTPRSEGGQDNP